MNIKAAIGLGAMIFASTPCLADTKFLLEVSNVDFEDAYVNIKPSALSLGVDYSFNEYFSVQGKYGFGLSDETDTTFLGRTEFEVNHLYSVYAKAYILPDMAVKPYAVIGYSKVKLTGSFNGNESGQSESDMSYGVGVEFDLTEQVSMHLDYQQLIDNSESEMTSINLGVSYGF